MSHVLGIIDVEGPGGCMQRIIHAPLRAEPELSSALGPLVTAVMLTRRAVDAFRREPQSPPVSAALIDAITRPIGLAVENARTFTKTTTALRARDEGPGERRRAFAECESEPTVESNMTG